MNLISILILIFGIITIIFPRQIVMFGKMWRFKGYPLPNKAITYVGRATGVLLIVLALIGIFK
jgi:hypothetical protein